MIHRFLIYDRKFNCRLDRRYPLSHPYNNYQINTNTNNLPTKVAPSINLQDQEGNNYNPVQPSNNTATWNTLIINYDSSDSDSGNEIETSPSQGSLVSQLSRMELQEESRPRGEEIIEHSQQLILGMTHSLKNMFTKLSPTVPNTVNNNPNSMVEGHGFSLKTSKYRLYYFESFTGWKLVMITDCSQSNTSINSPTFGQITPETALKTFYTQILLKWLLTYPLGTVYTEKKSTQTEKVIVENDFLHRSGFLSKMDEFIQSVDKMF